MIKTQNLTPEIYYKESRDFQLFGRLFDILFNDTKTNIDIMKNFPISNHTDSKLLELLVNTLGFFPKNEYKYEDLNAIANTYSIIIKNKGSIKGIETAIKTILRAENISKPFDITYDNATIYINWYEDVSNSEVALLEEIFDYILPAGMLYEMTKADIGEARPVKLAIKNSMKTSNLTKPLEQATIASSENDPISQTDINEGTSENWNDATLLPDTFNIGDIRLGVVADKGAANNS
jgi:hypothetical protein